MRKPRDGKSPARPRKQRSPEIEREIGSLVRIGRLAREMSQEQLGEKLGVTFQQVQKYENGANRVSASRLAEIAGALEVPISYFFPGANGGKRLAEPDPGAEPLSLLRTALGLRLLQAFYKIKDHNMKEAVVIIAENAAKVSEPQRNDQA
jgi:transcriptional regulator with XRE-family HTH domain